MTTSSRQRLKLALKAIYKLHAKAKGRDRADLWRISQHLVMVLESERERVS